MLILSIRFYEYYPEKRPTLISKNEKFNLIVEMGTSGPRRHSLDSFTARNLKCRLVVDTIHMLLLMEEIIVMLD